MPSFEGSWTCAGRGAVVPIRVEVEQAVLDRSFHPAVLIANRKDLEARAAAQRHTRNCLRPV